MNIERQEKINAIQELLQAKCKELELDYDEFIEWLKNRNVKKL